VLTKMFARQPSLMRSDVWFTQALPGRGWQDVDVGAHWMCAGAAPPLSEGGGKMKWIRIYTQVQIAIISIRT
jgi:hypothetical protein